MNIKILYHTALSLAVGSLLLGSGCAQVGTVSPSNRQAPSDPVPENVIFDDARLARRISVEGANQSTASGNLRRAQVVISSTYSKPQSLAYQFEWYDVDGMRVESVTTTWKPLRLLGGEGTSVSDVAPNPRAADFVLKIKRS